MMKKKIPYLPHKRGHLEENNKDVKSFSESDFTKLPDNVTDPIVSNNIATSEFDYTSDELYNNAGNK